MFKMIADEQLPQEDFENLILHKDRMTDYLQKLQKSCAKYKAKIEQRVQELILRGSERAKQLEKSSNELAELVAQKKELKEALNNVRLEQKVVEKQTINTIKDIEKTKIEIENAKEEREKLSLEVVDLQKDIEQKHLHMKNQWNAMKKACNKFKEVLDIRIDVENIEHDENVTVSFFQAENPTDNKFFVILLNQDGCWKVKKIEPELTMEQKYHLNKVVQFSKQSEVSDITLLLCELRRLFIKNYFENHTEVATSNT